MWYSSLDVACQLICLLPVGRRFVEDKLKSSYGVPGHASYRKIVASSRKWFASVLCPGTQMEWDVISEEIDTYY